MQNSEPAKHEQLSNIVSCEMQCSKVFCQQTLESFQISFHMRNNVARYFVNKHTSSFQISFHVKYKTKLEQQLKIEPSGIWSRDKIACVGV